MLSYIFLFLVGCILLYFGSEYLIDNSIILSKKFKISPIVIGATIIALGTSLPELLVSIYSIIFIDNGSSASGLIMGNILGSNIANVALVIGYCALVYTIIFENNFFKDLIFILCLGLYSIFCLYYQININYIHGLILLSLFFYYLYNLIKNNKIEDTQPLDTNINLFYSTFIIILSIFSLAFGAHLVVDNATKISTLLGFGSLTVGITIVALGTSLPELFTGVISIKKKNYNLLIGNIIGSNIMNIVFVLGISSLLADIKPSIDYFNLIYIGIALIISHLILILSYLFNRSISKISGFVLIVLYLFFLYKII
tara:strand:+ start:320 stop:1258 length:939 start_codon:yes stop_codon:yes gene_type:complete